MLFDDPQQGGPDIILSVEGKPVRTEADLRKALQAEKPGSIVTLRIYNPRAQTRRVERIHSSGEGQIEVAASSARRRVGHAPAADRRATPLPRPPHDDAATKPTG